MPHHQSGKFEFKNTTTPIMYKLTQL